jgi:ACS family tartrate transporter-like MFS transporter
MDSLEQRTMAKVNRRLVPFLFLVYCINFLDRVNVGFAALQMNQELGFTPAVYGLGAGIFFLGYFIFEVPSNMALHKVGARIWIARIMLSWGIVAMGMALVTSATSFYVARFLLGIAEAGFVPGLLLYVSYWYPERLRAGAVSKIWAATAIAVVIGSPISGALLSIDWLGLSGWKWMFILEGVPAVLLALASYKYLTDRPEQATWLDAEERVWLAGELASDEKNRSVSSVSSLAATLRSPRVWLLSLTYLTLGCGFFGLNFWLPQIIKQASGASNLAVGFLNSIPFLCAAVAMVVAGRWSDETGNRRWFYVSGVVIGAALLAASALAANPLVALVLMCLATMSIWSVISVFWTLPAAFLTGAGAAAGLAMINSIGGLGGFIGPYVIGWVRGANTGYAEALITIACIMLVGAALIAMSRPSRAVVGVMRPVRS